MGGFAAQNGIYSKWIVRPIQSAREFLGATTSVSFGHVVAVTAMHVAPMLFTEKRQERSATPASSSPAAALCDQNASSRVAGAQESMIR